MRPQRRRRCWPRRDGSAGSNRTDRGGEHAVSGTRPGGGGQPDAAGQCTGKRGAERETVVNLVHGAYCKTSMGKGEERIVMTSTEKKLVEDRLKKISERLAAQYREVLVDGHKFFAATDDSLFRVSVFPGEMALVIEYADSAEEAKENALEDGDRFYLDEMDFETMVRSMAAEIEGL